MVAFSLAIECQPVQVYPASRPVTAKRQHSQIQLQCQETSLKGLNLCKPPL